MAAIMVKKRKPREPQWWAERCVGVAGAMKVLEMLDGLDRGAHRFSYDGKEFRVWWAGDAPGIRIPDGAWLLFDLETQETLVLSDHEFRAQYTELGR